MNTKTPFRQARERRKLERALAHSRIRNLQLSVQNTVLANHRDILETKLREAEAKAIYLRMADEMPEGVLSAEARTSLAGALTNCPALISSVGQPEPTN